MIKGQYGCSRQSTRSRQHDDSLFVDGTAPSPQPNQDLPFHHATHTEPSAARQDHAVSGQARLCVADAGKDVVAAHAEIRARQYWPLLCVRLRLRALPPSSENFGECCVDPRPSPKSPDAPKGLRAFCLLARNAVSLPIARSSATGVSRAVLHRLAGSLAQTVVRRYSVARRLTNPLFNNQQSHYRPRAEMHGDPRGHSSVGRTRPCQGRGGRFETGCPLHTEASL